MIHKAMRYSVEREKVDIVKRAVVAFVDAVRVNEPGAIVYEVFQEHDGVSFVHSMIFKDEACAAEHRTAKHTEAFAEAVYPHCSSLPVFHELTLIRSTNLS